MSLPSIGNAFIELKLSLEEMLSEEYKEEKKTFIPLASPPTFKFEFS